MHGITKASEYDRLSDGSRLGRAADWLRARRNLLLVVVLPTLLVSFYLFVFAADQYESEAHFMVRSTQSSPAEGAGFGQALSLVGVSTSQTEGLSVGDYLSSHDAVNALNQNGQLVARFRRPEADFFSRLRSDPASETLVRYYRSMVDVRFDSATGIATLAVRAFRPEDSYAIVNQLLALGEKRVNALNQRAYQSTLGVARRQLAEAEEGVNQAQRRLTSYRQGNRDIDPKASGQAQITMVTELQAQLSAARAQEAAMAAAVAPNSPQLIAMRARVRALQAQVGSQSGRLTVGRGSIAAGLGGYQELELRQEFAAKRYDAAAAALAKARDEAQKQQLFVVRVVEPNMPQKALYPKRFKIIGTTLLALLLLYGIGWLIAAGVREHAA